VAAALVAGQPVESKSQQNGVAVVAVPVVLLTADNIKPVAIDSGFHVASALPDCSL
jgi:hypothetical protein